MKDLFKYLVYFLYDHNKTQNVETIKQKCIFISYLNRTRPFLSTKYYFLLRFNKRTDY